MIYTGENEVVLCKGDFHPAQLYKGVKKIVGYTETVFEATGKITLENCYNDKLYDVQINSKNLLDVKKVYPDYVNDEGGITFQRTDLQNIGWTYMSINWKANIQYTFSANYEITNSDNNSVFIRVDYTDGTQQSFWYSLGSNFTGSKSGKGSATTAAGKTVKRMYIGFTTGTRTIEVKLTNMQVEEGATATEYEPPCGEANIMVKLMENSEKKRAVLFKNGVLTEDIPTFKGTTVIEIESDIGATISGKYKRME